MTTALKLRCKATNAKGEPCKLYAIKGATVCRSHGGAAPQVKARAIVVAEARAWRLDDIAEDPGEVLLRLVTQSAARAQRYAAEIERLVDADGLNAALIGDVWIPTKVGSYKAGEYIKGMAKLEAQERDRCANFAAKAVAAGLAERQVRLAEKQGEMLAGIITAALADAQLPPEMADKVRTAIAMKMQELATDYHPKQIE